MFLNTQINEAFSVVALANMKLQGIDSSNGGTPVTTDNFLQIHKHIHTCLDKETEKYSL
jgi:acetyl-CoA acetyltransferase